MQQQNVLYELYITNKIERFSFKSGVSYRSQSIKKMARSVVVAINNFISLLQSFIESAKPV